MTKDYYYFFFFFVLKLTICSQIIVLLSIKMILTVKDLSILKYKLVRESIRFRFDGCHRDINLLAEMCLRRRCNKRLEIIGLNNERRELLLKTPPRLLIRRTPASLIAAPQQRRTSRTIGILAQSLTNFLNDQIPSRTIHTFGLIS